MEDEARRAERIPLHADIDFRRTGEHRWRVNIVDLSRQGCRVELPVRVSVDDVTWVSFPGLESLQGKVCWVKEWTAGIEFQKPLHDAVFDMLQKRMRGEQ